MVVMICIFVFGGIGFFIPRKYLSFYMLLASVCISSLYLFFTPPAGYDLYRHYELLHILRKMDFKTVLFADPQTGNWMLREYMDSSKVYLIFAYIISTFKVDGLLPAVSGIIIYGSVSRIIMMAAEDIGKDIEDWKISFCFFFLLIMMDFRAISGIRNMTAYALFAYVLYWDLVRNSKKILCIIAYAIISGIHSSLYILIGIRLLLILDKGMLKWALMAVVFVAYSLLDLLLAYLMRFMDVPFVASIIEKINVYGINGGTEYVLVLGIAHFVLIFIQLMIYIYFRAKMGGSSKFAKYGEFFLLFVLFAFGAIRQYDIFVRSNMLVYFMIYPFLLSFLNEVIDASPRDVVLPKSSTYGICEVGVYIMIIAAISLSLVMYYRFYYTSMDGGFHFI